MKKVFLFLSMVFVVFLASCASTAPSENDEVTVEEPEVTDQFDSAFSAVYGRYREGLHLEGAEKYIVKPGDVLNQIARRHYGTERRWYFPLIMLASSDVVQDPDELEVGMELTIPDVQKNLDDPTARESLKQFLLDIANVYDSKLAHLNENRDTIKPNEYKNRHDQYESSREGLRETAATL